MSGFALTKIRPQTFSPAAAKGGLLRRKCACGKHTVAGGECSDCREKRGQCLQRAATQRTGIPTENHVPDVVTNVLRSSGQPLEPAARAFMEPRFGHDFSRVRIHTDLAASQSAQAVNAHAYAVGQHIVFGSGQYRVSNADGRQLLAHELVHTMQQEIGDGRNEEAAEAEAESAANSIDSRHAIQVRGPAANGLQRQATSRPDVERDEIIGVSKKSPSPMRAIEIVWRLLTRYFPEYSPNVSGVAYEEKEPSIRVKVEEIERKGKKVQTATVTVGKAFAHATSDETLRERITELQVALAGLKAIPDSASSSGTAAVWKIIQSKFPKKGGRLALVSYDANLPGLSTEFKAASVTVGTLTSSSSSPRLYFGKAFLALPESEKESAIREEFKKIDKWTVDNARLTKADLEDDDITSRIRGLTSTQLAALENSAADPSVKTFAGSLKTAATPMSGDAVQNISGGFTISLPNVDVVVLPDRAGGRGNETTAVTNLPTGQFNFTIDSAGRITRFFKLNGRTRVPLAMPSKLVVTIQTRFQAITNADQASTYGKGTTPADVALGATTLRFHEGSHGKLFIDIVRSTNVPSLALGVVTPGDFRTITSMQARMGVQSCQVIDQVVGQGGVSQNTFLQTPAGRSSGIVSCGP